MTRLSVARAAGRLLFVLLEMFVLLVPFRARALPGPAGLTAEMDDPAQVAWTFYESIDQGVGTGDFRPAYNLMSRNAQKRRSYAAFSKGFVTTRSVVVEWIWPLSQDESEAVLEIDLVATDEIDGALRSVRYETVYTLVRERGQWRLDHAKTEQPPADVVRAFWDHLDRGIATGDCRAAYDLLSAARREECTYAEFAEVLDTVRRVRAEDVQLLERTEREATVRAVVYIAEEMDGTLDMSQRDVEFTLVREGSAWRVDWLDGTDRTMGDDVPELVYADPGTYHIGDEALRGWLPLTGLCWTDSFWVDGSGSASLLELELYGADSASQVLINGQWVATLPSQPTYWPGRRPNWWSERVSLPLGDVSLSEGWNTITLCATPLPDDPDSDDLQLRNIRVLADLEPVVPDLYLELGTASLPMRHGDTGKG